MFSCCLFGFFFADDFFVFCLFPATVILKSLFVSMAIVYNAELHKQYSCI